MNAVTKTSTLLGNAKIKTIRTYSTNFNKLKDLQVKSGIPKFQGPEFKFWLFMSLNFIIRTYTHYESQKIRASYNIRKKYLININLKLPLCSEKFILQIPKKLSFCLSNSVKNSKLNFFNFCYTFRLKKLKLSLF